MTNTSAFHLVRAAACAQAARDTELEMSVHNLQSEPECRTMAARLLPGGRLRVAAPEKERVS